MSPQEYRRLVEAGVFDEDARIELIDGLIVDMSPKGRAHENAIAWLARTLITATDPAVFDVRIASPLTLGASEPEPDIAVIAAAAPRPHHPSTASLVIEVASSSQQRDLVEKPRVYAAAGVPDYWVIDLDARRAVVHGDLAADAYRHVQAMPEGSELCPASPALPVIAVADVITAAQR